MAANTGEEAPTLPLGQQPSGISPHTTTTLNPPPPQAAPSEVLSPSVRFNSAVQEIAPQQNNTAPGAVPNFSRPTIDHGSLGDPADITPDELKALSKSLKACPLQERRMGIFSYEPYSLPVSRKVSLCGSIAYH
ncbi:hypothetical protein GE09DRAFT_1216643 [Coniochaeta sp. 2T2.1]|nr:hypothetical protein GE09DRAFT_1216643 [Coniochaeta sp. 2T2.1]